MLDDAVQDEWHDAAGPSLSHQDSHMPQVKALDPAFTTLVVDLFQHLLFNVHGAQRQQTNIVFQGHCKLAVHSDLG